jgi:hypothetical protein
MVCTVRNSALEAFATHVAPELVFAQVLVRRTGGAFELRHELDREANVLREVTPEMLRELSQFAGGGQFRPLKSAPTLRRGWRCVVQDSAELETALRHLYPGGVADWFAAQQSSPPITHYREYTARQTGMYRITTMLTDKQVGEVARAGCHRRFCLKQRLWTVEGLRPDSPAEKSALVCLEPCAVLMEFARAVVRIEQQGGELPLLDEAPPPNEIREADFSTPANPRFAQWRLEKQSAAELGKGS